MGAMEFFTYSVGENVEDAFNHAVRYAQYMSGHGGYTGTIAEKGSYVVIPASEVGDIDAMTYAKANCNRDKRIRDKSGPAGAILCKGVERQKHLDDQYYRGKPPSDKKVEVWLFFGFASW